MFVLVIEMRLTIHWCVVVHLLHGKVNGAGAIGLLCGKLDLCIVILYVISTGVRVYVNAGKYIHKYFCNGFNCTDRIIMSTLVDLRLLGISCCRVFRLK